MKTSGFCETGSLVGTVETACQNPSKFHGHLTVGVRPGRLVSTPVELGQRGVYSMLQGEQTVNLGGCERFAHCPDCGAKLDSPDPKKVTVAECDGCG